MKIAINLSVKNNSHSYSIDIINLVIKIKYSSIDTPKFSTKDLHAKQLLSYSNVKISKSPIRFLHLDNISFHVPRPLGPEGKKKEKNFHRLRSLKRPLFPSLSKLKIEIPILKLASTLVR